MYTRLLFSNGKTICQIVRHKLLSKCVTGIFKTEIIRDDDNGDTIADNGHSDYFLKKNNWRLQTI